jgi:hypothetical protein
MTSWSIVCCRQGAHCPDERGTPLAVHGQVQFGERPPRPQSIKLAPAAIGV